MFGSLQKKIVSVLVKPLLEYYLRKDRTTTVRGLRLYVKPGVFHPKFFFSSVYLSDFIEKLPLKGRSFLEVGCGSGLISLLAFKNGALVTAVDIDARAVECTRLNFQKNFPLSSAKFDVLESDLFNTLPEGFYEFIAINPPYFFENVETESQFAWNCGKNGEYFTKLFSGIGRYVTNDSKIYLVLAENCDLERITGLASQNQFRLELVETKKIAWEKNMIYSLAHQV